MANDYITEQLTLLDKTLPLKRVTTERGSLCVHLLKCPPFEIRHSIKGCEGCIGNNRMCDLQKIEPELTFENIERVVRVYELLCK